MPNKILLGGGRLFAIDGTGTSTEVGEVGEFSLEYSAEEKEFYGGKQYTLTTAIIKKAMSGKISYGIFNGALIAKLMGATTATGGTLVAVESTTNASYTVTNGANFLNNLSVTVNGVELKKVASAPQVGEYTVSGVGAYAFNASQTGTRVITYSYTSAATPNSLTITNGAPAVAPTFKLVANQNYDDMAVTFELNAVRFPKLSFGAKTEEFTSYDIEFKCQQDATGTVGKITYA